MNSTHWLELRGLFEQALDLEGTERAAFVEDSTRAGSDLRAELERMLAAEEGARGFLGDSAARALDDAFEGALPGPGERLGGYRIVRLLGRGGMGCVYEARQERPERAVALKVLQSALSTPELRRRFVAESQILARLRHPGIAQVYQSGVQRTASGLELPWFAMEYIEDARDLVSYARQRALDVPARLELFGELCAAVQHAHQKGVIHRDLKPANVLVDGQGRVKVIDYGVARLLDASPDATRHTRAGYVLGTLQYMSPEQLSQGAEEADARSDLYALGILLYELLAGQPPYLVEGSSLTELVARICERDPPPPSSAAPGLSRELDWIVLRALAKQPRERYASVSELAAELERFRRGEVLLAGPATRRYQLRKFVARHRLQVVAALLLLASLIAGMTSTGLALREVQAARAAEALQLQRTVTALERQTAVIETLRELTSGVRPDEDGREVTMFTLLERHRAELLDDPTGDPGLRAALLLFYTEAYYGLGQIREAAELGEATLAASAQDTNADTAVADRARHLLIGLRMAQNRHAEAEALVEEVEAHGAAQGAAATPEDELLDLRARALLLGGRGEFDTAIDLYRRLVEGARSQLREDNALIPIAMGELAELLNQTGRLEQARQVAEQGYAIALEQHGDESLWAATLAMRLGPIEGSLGHLERSLELEEFAVQVFTRDLGPAHSNTLVASEGLARALLLLGEPGEAERLLREALDTCREALGDDGVLNEMRIVHELASLLGATQRREERAELLRAALERLDALGQGDSPIAGQLRADLAR